MEAKRIILQGSSRSDGNTNKVVQELLKHLDCDFVDLKAKNISAYDYEHQNQDDDFLPLMRKVVEYDLLIFATPVYWYTMSSIMKTFFDRISDLLKIEKETGRKLRGKAMAVLACGSEEDPVEGYFIPFEKSADYLGMSYVGGLHAWVDEEDLDPELEALIQDFAIQLQEVEAEDL